MPREKREGKQGSEMMMS